MEAEIEALSGDRMDDVGGVAEQREALATNGRAIPNDSG